MGMWAGGAYSIRCRNRLARLTATRQRRALPGHSLDGPTAGARPHRCTGSGGGVRKAADATRFADQPNRRSLFQRSKYSLDARATNQISLTDKGFAARKVALLSTTGTDHHTRRLGDDVATGIRFVPLLSIAH